MYPKDASDISKAVNGIYLATNWYFFLIILQLFTIIVGFVSNHLTLEGACKYKNHKLFGRIRFGFSFAVLVACTVCFSFVSVKSGADDITYLAANKCSSDDVLNTSFKHVGEFTDHKGSRRLISIILIMIIFVLDCYQIINAWCCSPN